MQFLNDFKYWLMWWLIVTSAMNFEIRWWLNAKSSTFNKLVNQKHHSTLGSITTEKISKNHNAIPACKHFSKADHDFKNHEKFIIIEQPRNIRTTSTEATERLKEIFTIWSRPRPKLKQWHAEPSPVIFHFCVWSVGKWRQTSFSTCKSQILRILWEWPCPKLVWKEVCFY